MTQTTRVGKKSLGLLAVITAAILVSGIGHVQAEASKATADKTQRQLTIYNYEDYIGPDTIENFEKETGIKVHEVFFEDEEEIGKAVISNPGAYDLIVCSGDYLRELREAKLLSKLDYSKIPNFSNIDSGYKNQTYDPEQQYSVPFMVGTTGIVINTKYIPEDTDSWRILFNPEYKGRIAMLNNVYEVVAAAAKMRGYTINLRDPDKLTEIRKLLIEQKSIVRGYLGVIEIDKLMIEEKLWAAHIYSGEAMIIMQKNDNLAYIIPKEGAAVWIDSFSIPRYAKHKDEAHQFLNYILQPEVNAKIANYLWYATPNKAAEAFMDKEILASPEVYPPEKVKAQCEFFGDVGESTLFYNRIWRDLTLKR